MQKYQRRVISEQDALVLKVKKLDDFIGTETFRALPMEERDLLLRQSFAMHVYLGILVMRIARFKDASEA